MREFPVYGEAPLGRKTQMGPAPLVLLPFWREEEKDSSIAIDLAIDEIVESVPTGEKWVLILTPELPLAAIQWVLSQPLCRNCTGVEMELSNGERLSLKVR